MCNAVLQQFFSGEALSIKDRFRAKSKAVLSKTALFCFHGDIIASLIVIPTYAHSYAVVAVKVYHKMSVF